jgi:hypothetical protein
MPTSYAVLIYPDGRIIVVEDNEAEHEIRLAGATRRHSGLPESLAYKKKRWLKNRIRDWGKK